MGIYDREYYRRDGPSFLGSFTSQGQVCKALILANVVLFVLQMMGPQTVKTVVVDGEEFRRQSSWVTDVLELNTMAVMHGQVWRLLTYAFLHGSLGHIFWNMLFLWWFGKDVEGIYGPREFLAFYLVSAVVGGLAFQVAWLLNLQAGILCVGASGAVTAILLLCALHYPNRVILLMFFLPVPIWLFVAFEVAQDLFGFLSQAATGTAVTVHLGGAAFAFLYYKQHWRVLNLVPDLRGWQVLRSRPRLRVYREDQAAQQEDTLVPPSREADEHLEAKVDAVLEKVARYGQNSLTESERQILMRASEVYKKRRT